MEILPARPVLSPEHEKELAAARAFMERYGNKFADQANEICRGAVLEMMRMYQAHEHPGSWEHRDLMKLLSVANKTFRDLKIRQFKSLFDALDALCKETNLPQLTPRDFIKGSQLGPNLAEEEMVQFWDELWNQLPDKWRSADFRWHHIVFSGTELPFFVWIVRPPPPPPKRSFIVRRTKEEQAIFKKKWDKAIEKRNS
jgi:hypothetical protein